MKELRDAIYPFGQGWLTLTISAVSRALDAMGSDPGFERDAAGSENWGTTARGRRAEIAERARKCLIQP